MEKFSVEGRRGSLLTSLRILNWFESWEVQGGRRQTLKSIRRRGGGRGGGVFFAGFWGNLNFWFGNPQIILRTAGSSQNSDFAVGQERGKVVQFLTGDLDEYWLRTYFASFPVFQYSFQHFKCDNRQLVLLTPSAVTTLSIESWSEKRAWNYLTVSNWFHWVRFFVRVLTSFSAGFVVFFSKLHPPLFQLSLRC